MDSEMEINDILAKMLEAIESDNLWDSEAYAEMALEHINSGKPILNHDKDELVEHLNSVIEVARETAKKIKEAEKKKENLIDQIVNFKSHED
jgi:hypothetical protein